MQFMFLILALMCVVAAQNVTVSGGAISIVALSPLRTCLNACAEGDVNCKAQCVGVPYPDEAAANRTTACVAACPQGNGTLAETDGYANCQKACKMSRASSFPLLSLAQAFLPIFLAWALRWLPLGLTRQSPPPAAVRRPQRLAVMLALPLAAVLRPRTLILQVCYHSLFKAGADVFVASASVSTASSSISAADFAGLASSKVQLTVGSFAALLLGVAAVCKLGILTRG